MKKILSVLAAVAIALASLVTVGATSVAPAGAEGPWDGFCEWVWHEGLQEYQLQCPQAGSYTDVYEYGTNQIFYNFMAEGAGSDVGGVNVTISVWNYCGHPETGTNAENCYVIDAYGMIRGDENIYHLYHATMTDFIYIDQGGGDPWGYVTFHLAQYTGNNVLSHITWNDDTDALGCGSWVVCGHGFKAIEQHSGPPSPQNDPWYILGTTSEYNTGFARETKDWQYDDTYNVWWSTPRVYLGCDC